jgi:hypothetical protein
MDSMPLLYVAARPGVKRKGKKAPALAIPPSVFGMKNSDLRIHAKPSPVDWGMTPILLAPAEPGYLFLVSICSTFAICIVDPNSADDALF